MSSRLGAGSPLGWLCTKITEAADSLIASLNASLGCIGEFVNVPSETLYSRKSLFFASMNTATNISFLRFLKRGEKYAWIDWLDENTGLPSEDSPIRRLPSSK